ncbi:uncharacterized protein LOC103935916 isoform X2 [Pyrus x bretschneideri]|uniref:uncharacterized protein LOC103935916 isoform X2 n=1 Tax=Pyrus x bretschneideri TaxID=225117 RepID=UPI00202DE3FD|nr:uncharacterized protein LOC103935916 isoform X2 [Pyrus x bretschneideri]
MSNLVPYLNQIRTLYLDFQTPSSCHVAALPNSPLLSLSPTPRPHSLTLTFNSLSLCTHSPSLETLTSRSRTISRSAHTHKQPPSQSHHHQHPVVSLSLSLVAARRGEAQKTLRRVSSSSRLGFQKNGSERKPSFPVSRGCVSLNPTTSGPSMVNRSFCTQ